MPLSYSLYTFFYAKFVTARRVSCDRLASCKQFFTPFFPSPKNLDGSFCQLLASPRDGSGWARKYETRCLYTNTARFFFLPLSSPSGAVRASTNRQSGRRETRPEWKRCFSFLGKCSVDKSEKTRTHAHTNTHTRIRLPPAEILTGARISSHARAIRRVPDDMLTTGPAHLTSASAN